MQVSVEQQKEGERRGGERGEKGRRGEGGGVQVEDGWNRCKV